MLDFLKKDRNLDLIEELKGLRIGAAAIKKDSDELLALVGSIIEGKIKRTEETHERILELIKDIENVLHHDKKLAGMAENNEEKSKVEEPKERINRIQTN